MTRHRINGCWTCRLRRKKCDGRDPCSDCQSLGIDCCFQIQKPDWMDGGVSQRRKVEETKSRIKASAKQRRVQKLPRVVHRLQGAVSLIDTPPPSSVEQDARADTPVTVVSSEETIGSGTGPALVSQCAPIPTQLQPSRAVSAWQPQVEYAQELLDGVLLMSYMDYLFPIMYPLHRPSILEGGRCWILPILQYSSCIRSGVIALTSHLLGGLQSSEGSATQICEALDARHLHQQTQMALQSAQQDITAVQINATRTVVESARLLCNVVQLLHAETHLSENGRVHLAAAVSIFRYLLDDCPNTSGPGDAFEVVLEQLGSVFVLQRPQPPLFTPDQASFRFYAASLIFTDCIASTATGAEPQLHQYTNQVLRSNVDDHASPKLDIGAIFGVQNETLLIVSSIASLAAWKKLMTDKHQLSVLELAEKARILEVLLDQHLANLHVDDQPVLPLDILAGRAPLDGISAHAVQRIWALAARAYLFITTSGIQLANTKLRTDITDILSLLETIATREPSQAPAWYRALAWPICIAGLLVQSAQDKQFLRRLFRSLDPLAAFATVRRLTDTIEGVWEGREMDGPAGDCIIGMGLADLMGGVLLI
jgi:C6 transcription factor Pro1